MDFLTVCLCQLRRPKRVFSRFSPGFTMFELLVVMALLLLLAMVMGWLTIPKYLQRARDAKRKSQLDEYRIHLETYNTDKKTFPPATIMDSVDDCASTNLQPYMRTIYCDPLTKEPYEYQVSDDGQHYWLYANLEDDSDPDISEKGCAGGCGPDENGDGVGDYNYGVSDTLLEDQKIQIYDPGAYCQCIPGQCGVCCPGSRYRCNSDASGCYYDATCALN